MLPSKINLVAAMGSLMLSAASLAGAPDPLAADQQKHVATAISRVQSAKSIDESDCCIVLLDELFLKHRDRLSRDPKPVAELIRAFFPLVENGSAHQQYQVFDLGRDGPDSEAALNLLKKAASAGHPEAQYDLFKLLREQFPDQERLDLLNASVQGGSLRALADLAFLHEPISRWAVKGIWTRRFHNSGLIRPDPVKAFSLWLELSNRPPRKDYPDDLRQGVQGQASVASAYYGGRGTPRDVDAAMKLATAAANARALSGSFDAAFLLSRIYAEGNDGIQKDLDKAQFWCDEAMKIYGFPLGKLSCPFKK